MAVTISFPPNPEADIDHYDVFRSTNQTEAGPYTPIGQVEHDAESSSLSYLDLLGTSSDIYKLTAVNTSGVSSLATNAFHPVADSVLTRLYDTLLDASFHPIPGISVEAELTATALYNGVIVPKVVRTISDENGIWFLDLFPNSILTPATTQYIIKIQPIRIPKKITVPATVTVSYSSLVVLP